MRGKGLKEEEGGGGNEIKVDNYSGKRESKLILLLIKVIIVFKKHV